MFVMTRIDFHLQEKASLLFENLSSDLLCMKVIESEDTVIEIHAAVSAILEGVCRILDFSCNVSVSPSSSSPPR